MRRHALVAILPLVFTSALAHASPEAAQEARDACKTKRLGEPCEPAFVWDTGLPPGTLAAPGQGKWVKATAPAACVAGTPLPDGGTRLICRVTSPAAPTSGAPTSSAPSAISPTPNASTPPTGTPPGVSPSSAAAPAASSAAKPAEASRGCSSSSSPGGASSRGVLVALGVGALAFAARRRRELGADGTALDRD